MLSTLRARRTELPRTIQHPADPMVIGAITVSVVLGGLGFYGALRVAPKTTPTVPVVNPH
jgi:hypothetical protein